MLLHQLFYGQAFPACRLDLGDGLAAEIKSSDGHAVFQISGGQHLSGYEHGIIGLGMPVDLAEVYGSIVASGLLQALGDVAPEGSATLARGRLKLIDKTDYTWICLLEFFISNLRMASI